MSWWRILNIWRKTNGFKDLIRFMLILWFLISILILSSISVLLSLHYYHPMVYLLNETINYILGGFFYFIVIGLGSTVFIIVGWATIMIIIQSPEDIKKAMSSIKWASEEDLREVQKIMDS